MGTIAPAYHLPKRIYEVNGLRFVIFLQDRQVLIQLQIFKSSHVSIPLLINILFACNESGCIESQPGSGLKPPIWQYVSLSSDVMYIPPGGICSGLYGS